MDAISVHKGSPRAVCQYFKGHGTQGSAKTDLGDLFDTSLRRSVDLSFFTTPGKRMF